MQGFMETNALDIINLVLNVVTVLLIGFLFIRIGDVISSLQKTLEKLDNSIGQQTNFLMAITGNEEILRLKK